MKLGFCGCSYTHGTGVELAERYSSLVDPDAVNLSYRGASNHDILYQALSLVDKVDCLIVQWSGPGRQFFYPHPNHRYWSKHWGKRKEDIPRDIDKNRWKTFSEVYQLVDNLYNQYYWLNKQVRALNTIFDKIVYINGLVYMPDPKFPDFNYFNEDDFKECHKLLEVIDDRWIYKKPIELIDYGTDGQHPGPKTHRLIADKVIQYING